MNILYIVFGNNQQHHTQAYFSICTFLGQMTTNDRIYMLTDAPQFYQRLGDRIKVIETSQSLLTEWSGEHDFFWRIKIKAIEHICLLHPEEAVVYLDTDTFLYEQLSSLKIALQKPIMHLNEGQLSALKSKTERKMWSEVGAKSFGGMTITPHHCMWNAGVVGLPAQSLDTVRLALAICDDMLAAGVTRRLIEQFSLAVALSQKGEVQAAESFIAHFWAAKEEWNKLIQDFTLRSFLEGSTVEQDIVTISKLDFTTVPISQRIPNTQIRFKKWIEKRFPTEKKQYLTRLSTN